MDESTRKEKFSEYPVISALIAVILLIFALFLALTYSKEAEFSISGIAWLLKNNPVFWLIIAFTLIMPVTIYWIIRQFTIRLYQKQKQIDLEQARINQVNAFTQQLIHNNLDAEFTLAGDDDQLGESLINLRNTLKINEENNKKNRIAEEQRNWLAEGLTHFSEVLRNYINDPEQLYFQLIRDLTKYINAIQGGFYLYDDSDKYDRHFKLTAFFAYDRRKFANQKIKWGDGLIGTCALEQKTIYLKNIPDSYITVTSGLGEANPDNLVVVPMLYENQIYGVLELASFNKLEPNHITLIEKTAESVAATLSTVKMNQRTAQLLEESKAQTQTLSSHEEEMRQNMEELQATQEEALRQSQRLVHLENNLEQSILLAEFDTSGHFITGNSLFYKKLDFTSDVNIEGKFIAEFINEEYRDEFNRIWKQTVSQQKPFTGYLKHVTRSGKDLWTLSSLNYMQSEDTKEGQIMLLGIDISEERYKTIKQEKLIESIENTGIRIEMDINGNLLECNKPFINLFELSQKDLNSLVIFDIINPADLETFNRQWDSIINGGSYSGIIRAKSSKGKDIWLKGSINSVENAAHETDRAIFVGTDITYEKGMEAELRSAMETLKKQERHIKEAEKELANKLRETKLEYQNQHKEVEKAKNLIQIMLEESIDAIVATRNDNRIVSFNKAAELLWQTDRKDVLEQDISVLFPESLTEKDELIESFTRPGDHKITGERRKSVIIDRQGKEKPVTILLTKAKVENEHAYMAFIQYTA